jgi:hypothetical protein
MIDVEISELIGFHPFGLFQGCGVTFNRKEEPFNCKSETKGCNCGSERRAFRQSADETNQMSYVKFPLKVIHNSFKLAVMHFYHYRFNQL